MITLRCPTGTAGTCTGKLTLTARLAKKRRAVGSERFAIAAGKAPKLQIRLSAKARRALKKARKFKVRAAAAAKDANGTSKTTKELKPMDGQTSLAGDRFARLGSALWA